MWQALKRFNAGLGNIAGIFILITGFLAVVDALARTFFTPIDWIVDVNKYLLLLTVFFSSAYCFQEKGHVEVDMLREFLGKRFGIKVEKFMSIIAYLISIIFVTVLLIGSIDMTVEAISNGSLTNGMLQIPLSVLTLVMTAGSILMAVTLVFIIFELAREAKA